MSWGALAFVGIFALAAGCALWSWRVRRAGERRLLALGFTPCAADAPMLERAWRDVTRADAAHEIGVSGCLRRAAGWGMLHRFGVAERPPGRDADAPRVPAHYPAYLVDLRDPDSIARAAITLYVLPPGNRLARLLIEKTIALSATGAKLTLGGHPGTEPILCAYAEAGTKLDELMPVDVQQRVARAAAHGFLFVHIARGKAGFAASPAHRDVDAQLAYLTEWC
jgi:hypothetical protein